MQILTRSVNLLNRPSDSTRGKATIVFLLFPQKSWCCTTVMKEFPSLVNTIKMSYLFLGLHFLFSVLCHFLPFDSRCHSYDCMSNAVYLDLFGRSTPCCEWHEPPKAADHMHTSLTLCLWSIFMNFPVKIISSHAVCSRVSQRYNDCSTSCIFIRR